MKNPVSMKDPYEFGMVLRELQGLVQGIGWDLVDLAEVWDVF